jgi:hypothetical protein
MKFDFVKASLDLSNSDTNHVVPKIETVQQAREAHHRLVTALRESGEAGRNLARRIDACRSERCRSAACPVCLRHFRLWWGSEIAAYMDQGFNSWFTVNIVPSDQSFPIGELSRFRWDHVKDRLRQQIARSDLHRSILIGGFDYSLQAFKGERCPKWRPHMYFLTQTGGIRRIETALRPYYPRDEDTPRPVMVTEQKTSRTDLIATATYSFKSFFYERRPRADQRGNADTRHQVLAPARQAELALLLDKQGFSGRMLRRGSDPSFRLLTTR